MARNRGTSRKTRSRKRTLLSRGLWEGHMTRNGALLPNPPCDQIVAFNTLCEGSDYRLTMAPAPPKLSFLISYNTHPCLLCWAGNDQGPHEKKKRLGLGHTQSGNHGKTQADDGHLQAKDEAREESSPADASIQTSGLQNRPDVNACRLSRPACGAVPRGTS